jgi:hypothetical protein
MAARLEHCSPALRRCAGAPYAFLKYFRFLTSRIQTIGSELPRNSLKAQDVANGTPIALLFAPVMYGSSTQHRASLINTGYPAEQPHQSDRLGAALRKREEPAGKPEIEAGEIVAALQLTGRPVTSEKPGATLSRVAFRTSDHFFRRHQTSLRAGVPSSPGLLPKAVPPRTPTCHWVAFPVLSELPIKRLTQATRGLGRACSPQSQENIVRQSDCDQAVRDEGSYRKGHSQRKAGAVPG